MPAIFYNYQRKTWGVSQNGLRSFKGLTLDQALVKREYLYKLFVEKSGQKQEINI